MTVDKEEKKGKIMSFIFALRAVMFSPVWVNFRGAYNYFRNGK